MAAPRLGVRAPAAEQSPLHPCTLHSAPRTVNTCAAPSPAPNLWGDMPPATSGGAGDEAAAAAAVHHAERATSPASITSVASIVEVCARARA